MSIYFNGRPDGLGNRIEELIHLESYCIKNNVKAFYYWNNELWRKYPILIKCVNVEINTKKHNENIDHSKIIFFEKTQEDMLEASKNISYINDLSNDINDLSNDINDFIAIHIRATDKLNNRGKDEFTKDILIKNIENVINIINKNESKNIFICSDDIKIKNYVISKLNNKKIVDPLCDIIKNEIYKDFFTLTFAKSIYMCPKFSSYSAVACLIGNGKIYSFFDKKETSLYRYKCNIEYLE